MLKKKPVIPFKLLISLLPPLCVLLLPAGWLPFEGITIVEQRVTALFLLAALFWILEPIPIYATSVLIIVLELVMISDGGMKWFVEPSNVQGKGDLGVLLSYQEIMATFASPIILLFLGGFFLAMAATKYRLDQNLAKVLLRPFGARPKTVMLGLMAITAFFSMFMSNTATTAMMLSILVPVLQVFEPGDRGKAAFALSIPVAANLGGIGTPIGTPPNAIALKYLVGADSITFGKWMSFGIPFVIIMLLFSWLLLDRLFPISTKEIKLNIQGSFQRSAKAYVVYATFAVTILLWLTDFIHGMNAYVVALIPVAVFLSAGIINKEDLKKLSWDVLWLVAGGIALGLAMEKTGLAQRLVEAIPFASFPPLAILGLAAMIGILMANFMSNTATANLILPIIAALATSISGMEAIGGGAALIVGATLAVSLGMTLPISTPPNALAHATGEIHTPDMARVGVIVGMTGLLMIFLFIFILKQINFF